MHLNSSGSVEAAVGPDHRFGPDAPDNREHNPRSHSSEANWLCGMMGTHRFSSQLFSRIQDTIARAARSPGFHNRKNQGFNACVTSGRTAQAAGQ